MNLLFPKNNLLVTSLKEEDKSKYISEITGYRDELYASKNISKERLNFINARVLMCESRFGVKVRVENFKDNYQEDLLYRTENIVVAGIAGVIAMLLAFFLNKDSGGSSGGGGGGGRSTKTLTQQAEVKATHKVEKAKKSITDNNEVIVEIENPGYYPDDLKTIEDIVGLMANGRDSISNILNIITESYNSDVDKLEQFEKDKEDSDIFKEHKIEANEELLRIYKRMDKTKTFKDDYIMDDLESKVNCVPCGYPLPAPDWTKTLFLLLTPTFDGESLTEAKFTTKYFEPINQCSKEKILIKAPLAEVYKLAKKFEVTSKEYETHLSLKHDFAVKANFLEKYQVKESLSDLDPLVAVECRKLVKRMLSFMQAAKEIFSSFEEVFLHTKTMAVYLAAVAEFKTDSNGVVVV